MFPEKKAAARASPPPQQQASSGSHSHKTDNGRPPQKVKQHTSGAAAWALLRRSGTQAFSFRSSSGEELHHENIELFDGRSTFTVVKGQIPQNLLDDLKRDFTPAEVDIIFARIHKTLAPSVERPGALFVLGPSGVGKSSFSVAQATHLFGNDNNAVIVDGAEFREVHAGYQAVAVHGMEHKVLHSDAWKIFRTVGAENGSKEGISSKLKQRVLAEAIADRQHLIIPDCANNPSKLQEMLEHLKSEGYRLHAICLWAPLSVTKARGVPRSIRDGKLWSPDEHKLSTQGSLAMALRWDEGMKREPDVYRSLALWDNCHFPAEEVSLAKFVELTNYSEMEGDEHVARVTRTYNNHRIKLMRASAAAIAKMKKSKQHKTGKMLDAAHAWNEQAVAEASHSTRMPKPQRQQQQPPPSSSKPEAAATAASAPDGAAASAAAGGGGGGGGEPPPSSSSSWGFGGGGGGASASDAEAGGGGGGAASRSNGSSSADGGGDAAASSAPTAAAAGGDIESGFSAAAAPSVSISVPASTPGNMSPTQRLSDRSIGGSASARTGLRAAVRRGSAAVAKGAAEAARHVAFAPPPQPHVAELTTNTKLEKQERWRRRREGAACGGLIGLLLGGGLGVLLMYYVAVVPLQS